MMNVNEINALKEKLITDKNEEALALLMTVEQMQKESFEYRQAVLRKLNSLEKDMEHLVAEHEKQTILRDSAYVERDSCIGLLLKMAQLQGYVVGVKGNQAVLELKSGQVSWEFSDSESHLFEGLPEYTKQIEEMEITEKYRRVMNSGI